MLRCLLPPDYTTTRTTRELQPTQNSKELQLEGILPDRGVDYTTKATTKKNSPSLLAGGAFRKEEFLIAVESEQETFF